MSKRGRKPLEGLRKATRGKPSERHDVIRSVNFEDYGVKFALNLEIGRPGIIGKEKSAVLSIFLWGELPVACLAFATEGWCYGQTRPSLVEILTDPDKESGFDKQSHNRSISF